MKYASIVFMIGLMLIAGQATTRAHSSDDFESSAVEEAERMGDKVKEISQEMTRVFIQKLQQFLDQEVQRLRETTPKTSKELQRQLSAIETELKTHPDDAAAHYEVGQVYDRMGDGANAIIHMKKAETLKKAQGDVKGLAEARRNLRQYFQKYDFKPEDFEFDR